MSKSHAIAYIRHLGVDHGYEAVHGPASLPFTVDMFSPGDVPRYVYETFGALHTLTPGNHDADEAYRMLGRSVFPRAENGHGEPFAVAGESAMKSLLQQYHRAGNLVIFLSNNGISVDRGMRPGLGRERWDVAGPFQVGIVGGLDMPQFAFQSISRSESVQEALPHFSGDRFQGVVFPGR